MEYDNTNRVSLWRNERNRPDKRDPDLNGTINVEGFDGAEYIPYFWTEDGMMAFRLER